MIGSFSSDNAVNSTPSGAFISDKCMESPIDKLIKSTSIYVGKSFGKHNMSTSTIM